MRITLHGKDLAVPEMTGPMSAAVLKGALNHLLAQEVNYVNAVALAKDLGLAIEVAFTQVRPRSLHLSVAHADNNMLYKCCGAAAVNCDS
jgi:D-3-phosphoglycerate dehydrogenase intervening domain